MTTGALAVSVFLLGGPAPAPHPGIRWQTRIDDAMRIAKAHRKPVIVDFWATWCGWCKRLDQTTYLDPVVTKLAEGVVAVKVNAEGAAHEVEFAHRYDVTTLPTIAFLSPSGRLVSRVNGFQGPGQFPQSLTLAREEAHKVMGWEAAIEKNPKDSVALASLGVHMFEQEFYEEARHLLSQATRHDLGQPVSHRRRSRMFLAIIQNYDRQYSDAEALLKDALALLPQGDDEPKLLFILGRTYVSWGRRSEAQETMQVIVRDYSQNPFAQKAKDTLAVLDRKAN
jgi:thioredoxin-like negative regulator of GroEL